MSNGEKLLMASFAKINRRTSRVKVLNDQPILSDFILTTNQSTKSSELNPFVRQLDDSQKSSDINSSINIKDVTFSPPQNRLSGSRFNSSFQRKSLISPGTSSQSQKSNSQTKGRSEVQTLDPSIIKKKCQLPVAAKKQLDELLQLMELCKELLLIYKKNEDGSI